jgi:hypothetical protein
VHHKPPALDPELEAGAVFRRRRLETEQHRPVEQLDMDPAVLDGLGRLGELDPLARGGFRVQVGAGSGEFQNISLVTARPATMLTAD